ncbi:nickel-dependent hydrogenase large subunit [Collinsella tanakaei]|uniref:hydrogenase large subunit n=1 Tax=Collinsella tanakaei TaxID=626935 RepID=UPI00195A717A|nr:nickel-dependent hydrogenase large subunit [Collinsella tanakaei]MBM6756516.1 nickel-dependent hydrogenase large subunit [Collinsella tanakaei]
MATRTVIPFGPQHPVLPEPVHLDLVVEDERVVEAIPQIGFVHRGLEKLVQKRDYNQFVYVAERVCGICSFGHGYGYASAAEKLLGIEVPRRVDYLRAILEELSRIHSHLLWLGLLADGFGFESLFNHCWRLRETVLDIFQQTCGGRIILSICIVGGMAHDIDDSMLRDVCEKLEGMKHDYKIIVDTLMNDMSVRNRLCGVGTISFEDAIELSMVGPFAKGSGVEHDMRTTGFGAYADLEHFEPIIATEGDCYARCKVRCEEVFQAIDIIEELVAKIPHDGIGGKPGPKVVPPENSRAHVLIEQPRGEAFYYVRGNGTKYLDRFRLRTPTSQNLAGMVRALQGVDLADVPMIILTIDPCISCTER